MRDPGGFETRPYGDTAVRIDGVLRRGGHRVELGRSAEGAN